MPRQGHDKGGSLTDPLGLRLNATPVHPHELIHERQADSKAAATRYAALQWLATAASQTIRESDVNQIIVIGASAGSVET